MILQTKRAAEYSHRALAEAHRGIRIEFFVTMHERKGTE